MASKVDVAELKYPSTECFSLAFPYLPLPETKQKMNIPENYSCHGDSWWLTKVPWLMCVYKPDVSFRDDTKFRNSCVSSSSMKLLFCYGGPGTPSFYINQVRIKMKSEEGKIIF